MIVASLMCRARAASLLLLPREIAVSTSISRADSVSRGAARARFTMRVATAGDSTDSPLAAARMAVNSSARPQSLSR